MDWIEKRTKEFKEKYDIYNYLWTVDPKDSFEDFLNENEPKDIAEEDETIVNNNPLL